MADIRCSNCGKNNPDFFDVCQFCQAPLTLDPLLHIGEEPVKKDTGELEGILPDWLREAREQGKNVEAADDAFKSQTKPKVPKEEPPDLLAGLMSQADSDEDEIPDWLAGINPVEDKKSVSSQPSSAKDEPSDFFAQFKQAEEKPSATVENKPAKEELPAWMGAEEKPAESKDELTDWFSQTSAEPGAPFSLDATGGTVDDDSWMRNLGAFESTEPQTPVEKEPEDLGWLRDLEASSKGPDDSSAPKADAGFDFSTPSSDDDLSWLNNLGGTSAPSFEAPAPAQPAASAENLDWLKDFGGTPTPSFEEPVVAQSSSSDDDLSWLDNLGGTPAPSFQEPAPAQPSSSDEDLSWLNNLGGASVPSFDEQAPSQPASSGQDLDWLKDFGSTPAPSFEEPAPAQPSSSGEDLDWLKNLGGTPAPTFEEPAVTQPAASSGDLDWLSNLGDTSAPTFEEPAPAQPSSSQEDLDWLSSLGGTSETPAPSAPAFADTGELNSGQGIPPATSKPFRTAPLNEMFGDASIKDTTPDWLKSALEEPSMPASGELSLDWLSEHGKPGDKSAVPTPEQPASSQPAFDFSIGDSSTSSGQDVDAIFMDMPDWLSREPDNVEPAQSEAASETAGGDSLAPVELPSWVQAMRPVDSSIDEASASTLDQITEREGPLAGFQGVIPASPIGSSLRPKAFSLKLQITEEQQASASLLEQIIAGETTVQPRKAVEGVSSQVLRWVISGLFLLVLGAVIGLGLQVMPIYPSPSHGELSALVAGIPENAPVLVVADYEPSYVGELEASAGPLLDQLALSRHSVFTFVSMSPTGSALVDRLMLNTKISKPVDQQGLGYQSGVNYFKIGFLPGGSAGVLGFIEDPNDDFSQYATVILLTDNAETGRVWVEQLEAAGPEIAGKPLLLVSSAQAGPLLQPYVSSGQVDIMVSGLYDAAKYENMNVTRPGIARSYWDAFGFGLMMAVIAIVLGSVWSVVVRIRERRAEAEQG